MKRFDVGARVVEPTYGLGSVVAVEDAYTRVQFDEHGVKKFLTSMSHLEPSDEPVPAGLRSGKPRKKRITKKFEALIGLHRHALFVRDGWVRERKLQESLIPKSISQFRLEFLVLGHRR